MRKLLKERNDPDKWCERKCCGVFLVFAGVAIMFIELISSILETGWQEPNFEGNALALVVSGSALLGVTTIDGFFKHNGKEEGENGK